MELLIWSFLLFAYDLYGGIILFKLFSDFCIINNAKCIKKLKVHQNIVYFRSYDYIFEYFVEGKQYFSKANRNKKIFPLMIGGGDVNYKVGKEYKIFVNKTDKVLIFGCGDAWWIIVKRLLFTGLFILVL